jgi:predicted lipid-binding transport protein (Tim44 family)
MKGYGARLAAVLGVAMCIGLLSVESADAARRGGSFGSRGARTYAAPPPTRTAPQQAAPIQRSMTPPASGQQAARAAAPAPAAARAQPPRRGGFLGGLGGGLLGGLLLGGLVGALMGNGFGAGMAGVFAMMFQLALAAGVIFLVMKLFRRRQQPALAGVPNWADAAARREAAPQPAFGGHSPTQDHALASAETDHGVAIGVTGADRDTFERMLMEIQDGLGREDYAALRERTTPEVMGFLAEDLASHATAGRRNEISATRLLQADIAEAWQEGAREYATAAMRYESIDVVRDRATGAVLEGDPSRPVETTELWTFVRQDGGPWKLSAIQEA